MEEIKELKIKKLKILKCGTGDRSVSRRGYGGQQADCFGETAIIHTL